MLFNITNWLSEIIRGLDKKGKWILLLFGYVGGSISARLRDNGMCPTLKTSTKSSEYVTVVRQ